MKSSTESDSTDVVAIIQDDDTIGFEQPHQVALHSMDFHLIKEIRLGQNTKAFEIHGKRPDWEDRAFSIIYALDNPNSAGSGSGIYKKLNLVASTRQECLMWVTGLHMLLTQLNRSSEEIQLNMPSWLKSIWLQVDSHGTGFVDLDQLAILMPRVNIHLSKSEIKSALKIANIPKTGFVPFEAFERLYRTLRFRPEIAELFSQIANQKPSSITFEEFHAFMIEEQQTSWTEERCREIYAKFSSSDTEEMSMDHFTAFLISSNNHVFRKANMVQYQDMTRPLNEYFINTSHNTYLLGDQIRSESSVEGYIHALQKGCRCIELDCWDGPNGQPVITHGHTLTSKLPFRDALEVIAKYAFLASEYPLILSFETHCNSEQQGVMARLIREVLGDLLLLLPIHHESVLPSPAQLKRKILVKAKCGKLSSQSQHIQQHENDDDEDPFPQYTELSSSTASSSRPSVASASSSPSLSTESIFQRSSKVISTTALTSPSELTSRIRSLGIASGHHKTSGVAHALAELVVYCKGTPLHGLNLFPNLLPFDHIYSISEKKMNDILIKCPEDLRVLNRSHLTRVYPSPLRFDSSNFDPFPYWLSGTSMVAMNFQTFDRGLQLSHACFEDNGRCGYVLKPPFLRQTVGSVPRNTDPIHITIRIISGQQLPKQKEARLHEESIIPVCEIEFISAEDYIFPSNQDAAGGSPRSRVQINRFRTKAGRRGNPANPLWKEEFSCIVKDPHFAFLRFQVVDIESNKIGPGNGEVLGFYTISLTCLEKGYRHIPLHNRKGDRLRFSTLFVHIQMQYGSSQPCMAGLGIDVPRSPIMLLQDYYPTSS